MIRCEGLTLKAGARTLVDALTWQANAGESWVVIGRNGAGKSTLLKTLAMLSAPDGGRVLLDGEPLESFRARERARRIAYLPQAQHDAFGYRVLDVVLAARHPHDAGYWESGAEVERAHAALAELDLSGFAERDVRTLSGGERQRAALAALIAQDAPLWLLDEPSAALDLAHQMALASMTARARAAGRTLITVSHDLNLALQDATHALLLMGDGRWHAGETATLSAELLGDCLGYPLEALRHRGRTLYLPLGARPC